MASFRKRGRIWYFKFTNHLGRPVERKGCPDRRATEEMARAAETEAAKIRSGVIDPRDIAYAGHERRPLAEHLDDFRRSLEDKGDSAKHASVTANRARRVITLAKARRISDLSLSKVMDALAKLRQPGEDGEDKGLSVETINHHVRAVKAFSRWLWKDKRSREHALAHLATSNPESDRRRCRRSLTREEAGRLIVAAEAGPVVMGMTGPDRAMAYAVALGTGFRSDELRSLTPERFDLAAQLPAATVPGAYTKNGKEAVQPIPPALADRLRAWLATHPPGRPVFPLPDRTAEMLRVDLEAAGIPYETPAGVVDFHALRGTYISHLVSSGVSVKTCQSLARHSTPSLTIGIYAKASTDDIGRAMDGLPGVAPAMRTDVQKSDQLTSNPIATLLPLAGGASCRGVSDDAAGVEPAIDSTSAAMTGHKPLAVGHLDAQCRTPTQVDAEFRRWESNPHGGSPPEDFKSSKIAPSDAVNVNSDNDLRPISERLATLMPPDSCKASDLSREYPDLAEVIRLWPALPDAIRAGIVGMVRAAAPTTPADHPDAPPDDERRRRDDRHPPDMATRATPRPGGGRGGRRS